MAAEPGTEKKSQSNAWAWPVGILLGLAIGIPLLGSTGGIAFAIAFGATRKPPESRTGGDSDGDAGTTGSGPTRGGPEGSATGDDPGGSRQG
ncbi:hypothetical protein ACWD6N_01265 [Micromonospora sp. NPDC005163]